MDRLISLLEGEAATNLLWALAHTLWQGALVAVKILLRCPANMTRVELRDLRP
jgi:hypothetical protein